MYGVRVAAPEGIFCVFLLACPGCESTGPLKGCDIYIINGFRRCASQGGSGSTTCFQIALVKSRALRACNIGTAPTERTV